MPYMPASRAPRSAVAQGWRDADYRRVREVADGWRRAGIPADLAARFAAARIFNPHATRLAATFSLADLRALTDPDRHFAFADLGDLNALLTDEDAGRIWVGETGFPIREARRLHALGVAPRLAWAWQRRLSPFQQQTILSDALNVATLTHAVPVEHYDGWLTVAENHQVPFPGRVSGWTFLGGHTGLLADAGLSPEEADALLRSGPLDLLALGAMAALRKASA